MNQTRLCSECYSELILKDDQWYCPKCNRPAFDRYFEVDELCVEVIIWLNQNGYKTYTSCEGHRLNDNMIITPYISFFHEIPTELHQKLSQNLRIANVVVEKRGDKMAIYFEPKHEITCLDRFKFNLWKTNLWKQVTDLLVNNKVPPEGNICEICYNTLRISWSVSGEIWEKVVPVELQDRTICLNCFLNLAKSKDIKIDNDDIEIIEFA